LLDDDFGRLIHGHVDNLGRGLLDQDGRSIHLDGNVLTRFEVASCARLAAKRLDRIEHIPVLHRHGIAQFRPPFRIVAEELKYIRKRQQGLHMLVEREQVLVLVIRLVVVRLQVLQGDFDLIRSGRRRQDMAEQ
jgi:hypothetical protein